MISDKSPRYSWTFEGPSSGSPTGAGENAYVATLYETNAALEWINVYLVQNGMTVWYSS